MSNKNDFMEAGTEAQEMQPMPLEEQPTQMSLNEIKTAYTELRHDLALLATWETEFRDQFANRNSVDYGLLSFKYVFEIAYVGPDLRSARALVPVKIRDMCYDGIMRNQHRAEMTKALIVLTSKIQRLPSFCNQPAFYPCLYFSLEHLGLSLGCQPMSYESAHERMVARARNRRLGLR